MHKTKWNKSNEKKVKNNLVSLLKVHQHGNEASNIFVEESTIKNKEQGTTITVLT